MAGQQPGRDSQPSSENFDRRPEVAWRATLIRVRSEFQEMPCMRLTLAQARMLFGLDGPASVWIFERLEADGFLSRTAQGEYMRRPQAL
jgi:hypothetical protein